MKGKQAHIIKLTIYRGRNICGWLENSIVTINPASEVFMVQPRPMSGEGRFMNHRTLLKG